MGIFLLVILVVLYFVVRTTIGVGLRLYQAGVIALLCYGLWLWVLEPLWQSREAIVVGLVYALLAVAVAAIALLAFIHREEVFERTTDILATSRTLPPLGNSSIAAAKSQAVEAGRHADVAAKPPADRARRASSRHRVEASGRLRYRFEITGKNTLSLAREVVMGDSVLPLEHSLTVLAADRVRDPRFDASARDMAVEGILGIFREPVLPREAMTLLIDALAGSERVILDGEPVAVSSERVLPLARVVGAPGGVRLFIEQDDSVTQTFLNGVVLAGDTLRAMGDPELDGREREQLPRGQFFSNNQLGELVNEVLPSLEARIPVRVETDLAATRQGDPPRIQVTAAREGDQLEEEGLTPESNHEWIQRIEPSRTYVFEYVTGEKSLTYGISGADAIVGYERALAAFEAATERKILELAPPCGPECVVDSVGDTWKEWRHEMESLTEYYFKGKLKLDQDGNATNWADHLDSGVGKGHLELMIGWLLVAWLGDTDEKHGRLVMEDHQMFFSFSTVAT